MNENNATDGDIAAVYEYLTERFDRRQCATEIYRFGSIIPMTPQEKRLCTRHALLVRRALAEVTRKSTSEVRMAVVNHRAVYSQPFKETARRAKRVPWMEDVEELVQQNIKAEVYGKELDRALRRHRRRT